MNHWFWGPVLTMGAAGLFGACLGMCISLIVKARGLFGRIAAGVLFVGVFLSGVAFHAEHYVCDTNVAANRDCHWEF